jgi:hypothetical protein
MLFSLVEPFEELAVSADPRLWVIREPSFKL